MGLASSCGRDAVGRSITSPFPMHSEFERSGSRRSAVSPPLCLTERRLGTLAIVDSIPPNIERAVTGSVPFWQGPVLGPRIIEARNGALVIRIPHVAEFCVNSNSYHMNAKNGHTLERHGCVSGSFSTSRWKVSKLHRHGATSKHARRRGFQLSCTCHGGWIWFG